MPCKRAPKPYGRRLGSPAPITRHRSRAGPIRTAARRHRARARFPGARSSSWTSRPRRSRIRRLIAYSRSSASLKRAAPRSSTFRTISRRSSKWRTASPCLGTAGWSERCPMSEVTRPTLIRMMIGRDIDEKARPVVNKGGEEILFGQRICDAERALDGVSLTVRAGEVIGIAGLVGSGRSELLRAIFGADRIDGGEMQLHGKPYSPRSPIDAVGGRTSDLSRKTEKARGARLRDSPSVDNLSLPSLRRSSRLLGVWLGPQSRTDAGDGDGEESEDRSAGSGLAGEPLSGGNQQKVVLESGWRRSPKLLLVDEPTHGVDVGAREEIYRVIDDLAQPGCGRGRGVLLSAGGSAHKRPHSRNARRTGRARDAARRR